MAVFVVLIWSYRWRLMYTSKMATCSVWMLVGVVCILFVAMVWADDTCMQKGNDVGCGSTQAGVEQKKKANMERTFLMIKPDGVHRGLVGEIIKRFETKGYKLVAFKFVQATEDMLGQHYAEHEGKGFYEGLLKYIMSGPIVPMVWEGKQVISTGRSIIGATNPLTAPPGTIRGDYGIVVGRNIIHGSDSEDSAKREISIWFTDEELVEWEPAQSAWVYE